VLIEAEPRYRLSPLVPPSARLRGTFVFSPSNMDEPVTGLRPLDDQEDKLFLRKRCRPEAMYRKRDDAFVINESLSYDAEIFREAPQFIVCDSIADVMEQWDIPIAIITSIYIQLNRNESN